MNPVIEAFRGAAALLVLLHHYSYQAAPPDALPWLHFFHNGVDLFFVITGFLFAPYLLGTARMAPGAFAVRRAFRLYPLYAVSFVIGLATLWGWPPGTGTHLVRHLFFIQALPVFPPQDAGYFSAVYWTLPVEVGFYLLVCIALRLGARDEAVGEDANAGATAARDEPGARLVILGGVAAVLFVAFQFIGGAPGDARWVQWQAQLPALLLEFWFGMVLAVAWPRLRAQPGAGTVALLAGVVLMAGLFAAYPWIAEGNRAPRPFGWFNAASALGYALLLAGCLSLAARRGRASALWARAGVAAGSLSYGVYLFHNIGLAWVHAIVPSWPMLARLVVGAFVTFALSALLHVAIEEPMRSLGRRLSSPRRPPS